MLEFIADGGLLALVGINVGLGEISLARNLAELGWNDSAVVGKKASAIVGQIKMGIVAENGQLRRFVRLVFNAWRDTPRNSLAKSV